GQRQHERCSPRARFRQDATDAQDNAQERHSDMKDCIEAFEICLRSPLQGEDSCLRMFLQYRLRVSGVDEQGISLIVVEVHDVSGLEIPCESPCQYDQDDKAQSEREAGFQPEPTVHMVSFPELAQKFR